MWEKEERSTEKTQMYLRHWWSMMFFITLWINPKNQDTGSSTGFITKHIFMDMFFNHTEHTWSIHTSQYQQEQFRQ